MKGAGAGKNTNLTIEDRTNKNFQSKKVAFYFLSCARNTRK